MLITPKQNIFLYSEVYKRMQQVRPYMSKDSLRKKVHEYSRVISDAAVTVDDIPTLIECLIPKNDNLDFS